MKFCMVTTFYPPYHFGGDGTYIRALSRALVALGHDVTVVHCEDAFALNGDLSAVAEPSDDRIDVHRLKSAAGMLSPLLTQQLGIPALKSKKLGELLQRDFDVVHFHNISLIGGPGVLRLSNAPVTLYTLHEHWLLCPTHIFWKNRKAACEKRACFTCSLRSGIPPQIWRYSGFLQSCLQSVDAFLSPSHYTAARHEERLPVTDRVKVLPLFSMLEASEPQAQPHSAGKFLYVGRVTAAKGIAELLSAFAGWPQFELSVVGEGDQLLSLQAQYRHCQNIQFLGVLPQEVLSEHYQRATALILPSLAPETFGLTVVEAFACGTPAIVRIAGGNREAIDVSSAGMLYEDNQGLLAALTHFSTDNTARERLGRLASAAYKLHYTPDLHLERYLAIVESVRKRKENNIVVG